MTIGFERKEQSEDVVLPIKWVGGGNCVAAITATAINSLGSLDRKLSAVEVGACFKRYSLDSVAPAIKALQSAYGEIGVQFDIVPISHRKYLADIIFTSVFCGQLVQLMVAIDAWQSKVLSFPGGRIMTLTERADEWIFGDWNITHAVLAHGYSKDGLSVYVSDYAKESIKVSIDHLLQSLPHAGIASDYQVIGIFSKTR